MCVWYNIKYLYNHNNNKWKWLRWVRNAAAGATTKCGNAGASLVAFNFIYSYLLNNRRV